MTAKNIDRKKRITDFIEKINDITVNNRLWVKKHQKYKEPLDKGTLVDGRHKAIAGVCINELRYLGEGKTKKEYQSKGGHQKIAPSTFLSYLTDYRNAIQDLNQKGLNTENKVKILQKKFKDTDLSLLDAKMPELRKNLDSLKKKYIGTDQDLYGCLHKLRIENHAFYVMRGKPAVKKLVKLENAKNLKYKHDNQKTINKAHIYQALEELYTSNHWVDLSIFIAIASGRRPIEILKTGSFVKSKKNHVFFKGQAKTKNRSEPDSFIIPTLTTPKKLIETHKRLKEILGKEIFYDKNFNDLTNEEVNGATAGRLNKKVKSIFDNDSLTFKDLRVAYTKLAAEQFHNEKELSIASFYASILGHSESDVQTQENYKGLVILDKEIEPAKIEHTTDEKNYGDSKYKTLKEIEEFDKYIQEAQGTTIEVPKFNQKAQKWEITDRRIGKAETRIHEFVKKTLQQNKDAIITQTFLGKPKAMGGLGANRPAIHAYLFITGIDQKYQDK